MKPTKPLAELTWERQGLVGQSMDGVLPGLPASIGAPVQPFVVQTSRTNFGALMALFTTGATLTFTGDSSKQVVIEVMSSSYESVAAASDSLVHVTFQVRFPGVYWRDAAAVTSSTAALAASVTVAGLLPGITGAVTDAIVRVKGQTQGLQVTDSGGSWFTYTDNLPSTSYLRFDAGVGQAFVTKSDTWTGGTNVSGQVSFGGPRGVFELTPIIASGNPLSRSARITVTAGQWPGASIQVRGRATYLL